MAWTTIAMKSVWPNQRTGPLLNLGQSGRHVLGRRSRRGVRSTTRIAHRTRLRTPRQCCLHLANFKQTILWLCHALHRFRRRKSLFHLGQQSGRHALGLRSRSGGRSTTRIGLWTRLRTPSPRPRWRPLVNFRQKALQLCHPLHRLRRRKSLSRLSQHSGLHVLGLPSRGGARSTT